MKKVWRVSDQSTGMMYEIEGEKESWPPKRLAEYLGRCETGEIIYVWDSGKDTDSPAHVFFWDSQRRTYRASRFLS